MSESSTPDHLQQLLQSESREKEILLRLLAMLEGNSPEHVRQTLEEIRRIAKADLAIVTSQDGEIYWPWMWVGQASEKLQDSFKQGIPQAVVRQLRNQLGRDYQLLDTQDHLLAPSMQALGISATLVLSFNHNDSLEGLVLHRFEQREGWSEAELRLLRSAAHTLGAVITRIERTRQLEADLAERQTLLRLSKLLEGNTEAHIQQALEEILRLARADAALVLQNDQGFYRPRMWEGQVSLPLRQIFEAQISPEQAADIIAAFGTDFQVLDDGDHLLTPSMQSVGVQAALVLSLNANDQLEVLVLHRVQRREGWSKAETELLRSAARTLGAVITRVERTRQLEARNHELETVALVSQGLNRASTLEEAAETLAQQIIKLTQANQSSVKVLSSDGQSLQNIASHGFPQLSGSLVPRGTGLSWLALATQQPSVTQDSLSDPRVYFAPLKEIDQWPRSVAYVPMFGADGEALGVLGLAYWEPKRVRETDLQTLSIIANIAAATLERLKADQALRQRNRELETVVNLSEALKRAISHEEVTQITLEQTLELTHSRSAVMLAQSPDGDYLLPTHSVGSFTGWQPIPRPQGIAWESWQSREMRVTADALSEPGVFNPGGFPDLPRSRAAVPLFGFDRQVVAVLGVTRDEAGGFSSEELKVFRLIGEVVSSALERVEATAQLMRQLHESQVMLNTVKTIAGNSFDTIWADLLRATVDLVPKVQAGSIFVREIDRYVMVAQHGYDDSLLGIRMDPLVEGYWFGSIEDLQQGRARIGRREFVTRVMENDQRFLEPRIVEKLSAFGKMAELQCTVCIPIFSGRELVAYINLDNFSNELDLDEESVQIAQRFAVQVAALVAARRQKESLDTT